MMAVTASTESKNEPVPYCALNASLTQWLDDPLIRLVMASDGVVEADIRRLAVRAAARGGASGLGRPASTGCAGEA